MAISDFRYSDQDFFRSICPDYGKYDSRVHLKNFVVNSGDRWKMSSVGTTFSQVYFDGEVGTEVTKSHGLISAFSSGSNTRVTALNHDLSNGEFVKITGTTNYDGDSYLISNVVAKVSFDINATYIPELGEGNWELSEASTIARVSANKEWYHNIEEDLLYIYVATASDDPNDDEVIEIGEDRSTFINQTISNASQ